MYHDHINISSSLSNEDEDGNGNDNIKKSNNNHVHHTHRRLRCKIPWKKFYEERKYKIAVAFFPSELRCGPLEFSSSKIHQHLQQ